MMGKSILDQLEASRVDVRQAIVREDITGSGYKLDPKQFKYVLIIPIWEMEMRWAKYEDLCPYVNHLDYLFSAFTHDYQILLRKTDDGVDIPSEYFIDDNLVKQHPLSGALYEMHVKAYAGGIFVQFNTQRDWTYKTIYRFLVALINVICRQENMHSERGKDLYIYRCRSDEPELIGNYWNTEIVNRPLYKFSTMLNLKKLNDMGANEIVTKTYTNATILAKTVQHFIKPDFDFTESEFNVLKQHIYNNFLLKMRSPVRCQISNGKDVFE